MKNYANAYERKEYFRTIFNEERFKSWLCIIATFLYFPLGLMIAAARISIGIQVFLISLILQKSFIFPRSVLKVIAAALGFVVIEKDSENIQDTAKVIIANHVTNFDHVAVLLSKKCVVPNEANYSLFWNNIMGYTDFGVRKGMQRVVETTRKHIQDSEVPLLMFPEGVTTNGKSSLLKFRIWPFTLSNSVQPITIEVHRPPLLNISPSIIGSGWSSDLLWFIFLPYTVFIVRFLPVVKRGNETTYEFCKNVQNRISTKLKLRETHLTSYDIAEYIENKSKFL